MSIKFLIRSCVVFLLLLFPAQDSIVSNVFAGKSQAKMQQLLRRIPRISPSVAYFKVQSGTVILIDTMSPVSYKRKHILGAINLPYDGSKDLERIKRMKLPFPKNQEIIFY